MERKMSDTPFKQYKKETFYQGPKKQELPSCFKLPYLRFKKTKEKNVQKLFQGLDLNQEGEALTDSSESKPWR